MRLMVAHLVSTINKMKQTTDKEDTMKYAIKINSVNKYYDPSLSVGAKMSEVVDNPLWMVIDQADNHCQAFNRRHPSGLIAIVVDVDGNEFTDNDCFMLR